jgi:hypothetical protein
MRNEFDGTSEVGGMVELHYSFNSHILSKLQKLVLLVPEASHSIEGWLRGRLSLFVYSLLTSFSSSRAVTLLNAPPEQAGYN